MHGRRQPEHQAADLVKCTARCQRAAHAANADRDEANDQKPEARPVAGRPHRPVQDEHGHRFPEPVPGLLPQLQQPIRDARTQRRSWCRPDAATIIHELEDDQFQNDRPAEHGYAVGGAAGEL